MVSQGSILLGSLLALGQLAAALQLSQVGNCSAASSAASGFADIAYFNATGTRKLDMKAVSGSNEPWYYHVTIATSDQPGKSTIWRWLSVPESFAESKTANSTNFCMYSIAGKKGGKKNKNDGDSCNKVVSSTCARELLNVPSQRLKDGRCPRLSPRDCKTDGLYFTSKQLSLSKMSSCFVEQLPAVSVPKKYISLRIFGASYEKTGESTEDAFARAVKEQIPSFFSFIDTSAPGDAVTVKATRAVCAAPSDVHGGKNTGSGGRMEVPAALVVGTAVLCSLAML